MPPAATEAFAGPEGALAVPALSRGGEGAWHLFSCLQKQVGLYRQIAAL